MAQIRSGTRAISGIMIESFIEEGNQSVEDGKELVFDKSITDACINRDDTAKNAGGTGEDQQKTDEIV